MSATINQGASQESGSTTIEKIREAASIIEALAQAKAPDGAYVMHGVTGLRVIKNPMIPSDTIMVSENLFDLLYESRLSAMEAQK